MEIRRSDTADQDGKSSHKSGDEEIRDRLTDMDESDDNSLTEKETEVSCDKSSRQLVGESVKGKDETSVSLSDCVTSCLTRQTGNYLSHFSSTRNCHTESSLLSIVNPVNNTPNKSQQLGNLPSTPSPTLCPSIQRNPNDTNLSTVNTTTSRFWQLLWSLEAKSDLSPLPTSSTSTSLMSPLQSSLRKALQGPALSPLSSRSQQMDEVVNSLRSSGSKRKLLFGTLSDSEEDSSLPSPKRFSSAVATSARLVRPKPIRQARTIAMTTQSETVTNETRPVVPAPQLEQRVFAMSTQTTPSKSVSRAVSDTTKAFSVDADLLVAAGNQSIAGRSGSGGVVDGDIEEGELVEEPVEAAVELEVMKPTKVVRKKSGVNRRPLSQSEDSCKIVGVVVMR